MIKTRVIPILLIKENELVKTVKFNKPNYIGDPINTIKIFNDKGADEILVLDIMATTNNKGTNFSLVKSIASECFMPLTYGGGIKKISKIRELLKIGVEKVSINSAAIKEPELIREASKIFGSSTIVVSIDVKKNIFGKYQVVCKNGRIKTNLDPIEHAKKMVDLGAGELLINSVNKDGTMTGYDLDLIKLITGSVNIPVIACGGAGTLEDFTKARNISDASAVAAGSFFIYHGKHKAVLINYPSYEELENILP